MRAASLTAPSNPSKIRHMNTTDIEMQTDMALRAHDLGARYVRRKHKLRALIGVMPQWLIEAARAELAEIHTAWRAVRNELRGGK